MPVVLSRGNSTRPEDAHLIHLRNEALRHRSHRFIFSPSKAAEIEKAQKIAYEKQTKKPSLPKPSPPCSNDEDAGEPEFSDPEWEPQRSCWLVYRRSNSSQWMAWEPMKEKWVGLGEWDESCSPSPTSSDGTKSDGAVSKVKGKTVDGENSSGDRPISRTASLPERDKPRYTFRSVAQTAWKVLAWKRRASSSEK